MLVLWSLQRTVSAPGLMNVLLNGQLCVCVCVCMSVRSHFSTRISCRWQTRATRSIMAKVMQTNNVNAQCDKLATELSWQRFSSKVANFQPQHLHLTYLTCIWHFRWGWSLLNFVVWRCLHDPTFSHFSRTPTWDRRTDGQTDTRRQLIPVLASVTRVKTTCPNFTKCSVHVTCRRDTVLLWQQYNALCTSGFVDDVMFSHNKSYGA